MIKLTATGNKLYGFYYGKVVKHMSHGVIKVFIPSVYPAEFEEKPELLPNCLLVVPQFGGNNSGNGVYSYPNIGSIVVCSFSNGDQNYPITIGSLLGGNDAIHQYNIINQIDDYNVISTSLSDDNYVHDNTYTIVHDISSTSKLHRITSGKTNLTFFEHDDVEQAGIISSNICLPILTHVSSETFNPEILDTYEEAVIHGTDQNTNGYILNAVTNNINLIKTLTEISESGTILARTTDTKNSVKSDILETTTGKVRLETFNNLSQITSFLQLDTNGSIRTLTLNNNDKNKVLSFLLIDTSGIIRNEVHDKLQNVKSYQQLDTLGIVRSETYDIENKIVSYSHLDTVGIIHDETFTFTGDKKKSSYSHLDTEGIVHNETFDDSSKISSYSHLDIQGYVELYTLNNNTVSSYALLNSKDGFIELKSLTTDKYCKIYMTKDGSLTIDTTTNITIKSPSIELNGAGSIKLTSPDVTIGSGSVTINGSSVNITGSSGDCLINGKSLVGHMHTGNLGAPTSPPN